METFTRKSLCAVVLGAVLATGPARAQPTVSFPQTGPAAFQSGAYNQPGPGIAPPGGAPTLTAPPPSTLGTPAFDPYSMNPGAASVPPSLSTPPSPYGLPAAPAPGTLPPYGGAAGGLPGTTMAPYSQPYGGYPPGGYPPGGYPPGGYPPGAAPGTTPPSMYPNGWSTSNWALPSTRFLTPRVRHTYVGGGDAANDLGIHDTDVSVAAAFPNFLYSNQPLYVVPSFSLHLWSGPRPPHGDLPANAYSAFLDFGWSTDPVKPVGGEVGVRLGVFSDFNTINTHSGRIMGQGLLRVQMTPATTLRGGLMYIDRNDLKLLPAFGILWTPNSQTRFDIFFPHPKLAQQLTTIGNQDVWWYVGGEYGGGAWTVEREDGLSDRIDINDIRLTLGVEWGQSALLQQGRRTGFFEAGWVTSREIVYVVRPEETTSISDSFMLRIGWNY